MTSKTNSGFTIIETMLFLAVSAVLFAAIIVSVGAGVERQRYKDSVTSLKSYIQEQYSRAANTVNGRSGAESCGLSGSSITMNNAAGAAAQKPGMSECMIIGRYIEVDDYAGSASDYGKALLVSNVIAYPYRDSSCADTASSDIEDLRCNYVLQRSTTERDRYEVAWGNKLVSETNSSEYKQFSMMIVRSPQSGAMMTLISPSTKMSTTNFPKATNPLGQALNLCVSGGPTGRKPTGVRIPANMSNQSGVQVMTDTESVCQ